MGGFDYVLVNRNAHVFSPYRNVPSEEFSPDAAHEFNIADSPGKLNISTNTTCGTRLANPSPVSNARLSHAISARTFSRRTLNSLSHFRFITHRSSPSECTSTSFSLPQTNKTSVRVCSDY